MDNFSLRVFGTCVARDSADFAKHALSAPSRRNRRWQLALFSGLFACSQLSAAPLPGDLAVGGGIFYDDLSTIDEGPRTTEPPGEHGGDFGVTSGGITTTSSFSNTAATGPVVIGPNPQAAPFSDTGDGTGGSIDWFSASEGGDSSEQITGFDFGMDLENTSATDSLDVDLVLTYSFLVDVDGPDAYSVIDFVIEDTGSTEHFFALLVSDSLVGDEFLATDSAPPPPGTFGAPISHSGSFAFTITLAPLATESLIGIMTVDSLALDGSSFGSGSFFLSFAEPVPAPLIPGLMLSAAALLFLQRRHASRRHTSPHITPHTPN